MIRYFLTQLIWDRTMRYTFLLFITLLFTGVSAAQDRESGTAVEPLTRDALLKRAVAQDRGDITAMESSSKHSGGVVIGHSSGTLFHCYGDDDCREFDGTPSQAVEDIAVSRRGDLEIFWVAYRHGVLYQCINYQCREFKGYDSQEQ